jgi:hypothetical protein
MEDPKEGGDDEVGMVGSLCWCDCKGEGVGCTPVQNEPPWLSFALGVANRGLNGLVES